MYMYCAGKGPRKNLGHMRLKKPIFNTAGHLIKLCAGRRTIETCVLGYKYNRETKNERPIAPYSRGMPSVRTKATPAERTAETRASVHTTAVLASARTVGAAIRSTR